MTDPYASPLPKNQDISYTAPKQGDLSQDAITSKHHLSTDISSSAAGVSAFLPVIGLQKRHECSFDDVVPLNPFKVTNNNEKLLLIREREREIERLDKLKRKFNPKQKHYIEKQMREGLLKEVR